MTFVDVTGTHAYIAGTMALIQFVENYDDPSTDRGFQFKFYCDKCRNGYLSGFQASIVGTAGSLFRPAGDIFRGVFRPARNSGYEIRPAPGGKPNGAPPGPAGPRAK